jgi:alanine racemase
MGRIGILPSEVPSFSRALMTFPDLRLEGVMSHLAVADDLGQTEFTASQIEALDSATDAFREAGHGPIYIDIANSPGAVAHPSARKKIVRLGGILYGLGGDVLPKQAPAPELRPVMSLRTKISGIKDFPAGAPLGYGKTYVTDRPSKIATIPIGYHDGLPRVLSNRGTVLVRGRRAPIRGRISMDWTIIDVTEIPGVELYDDVTVIGADLEERILAEDLAIEAGTISYEITCGIGARVPRSYDSGE